MKTTMTQYLSRTVFLLSLALVQSCGGSGGGGSSSPPGILFYALTEDSGGHGYIVENAISPSGQLYSPAPSPISTGGASANSQDTVPVAFVLDPNASLAFALNSNSTSNSFYLGSIESYNTSTAQSTTGITSVSYTQTGTNPTSMAVDPGGNYLVVADHGSGTSSNLGDVEIFQIGSNGALSGPTTASLSSSSCPNPDKIVFPPSGSNGTSSDTFYVVCSSPELISSTPPPPALYICQISGSCSSITLQGFSNSNAISNMEFASNGTAFLPGETYASSSSYNAFLITCSGTPLSSCTSPTQISSTSDTAPAEILQSITDRTGPRPPPLSGTTAHPVVIPFPIQEFSSPAHLPIALHRSSPTPLPAHPPILPQAPGKPVFISFPHRILFLQILRIFQAHPQAPSTIALSQQLHLAARQEQPQIIPSASRSTRQENLPLFLHGPVRSQSFRWNQTAH